MDKYAKEILKELLPEEKEVVAPPPCKDAAPHADHWSPGILLERARYLRELARLGDGQASETLKEYPGHFTMLSFRSRDGGAEWHERFADIFYVLSGKATLVTGGTIVGAQTTGPGEMRGDRVEGGMRQELRLGDVAHVPAGVPHQMLVSSEHNFSAFVVKVQETP